MERTIFEPEHDLFRETARTFVAKEIEPHHEVWDRAGKVDKEMFRKAGRQGLLGMAIPEGYGGGGVTDFRYNVVIDEEISSTIAAPSGFCITLHNDVCLPYFLSYGNEEQKERWFPGLANGDLMTAIAMTEPGTGSDLSGIATSAVRDGDAYVINGSKTFTTNGINSDLVIVVTRTGEDPHRGLTLLVVEEGMPGFERGRNLEKIGLHAQDTAELFFTDVRVPVANRLGEEGMGFFQLMANLPQERLSIAVGATAGAEAVFAMTLAYVKERRAFGRPIGSFQASRFKMATMKTEIDITRAFIDRCIEEHVAGRLTI
ncbi:MAG: acyl-CoA dehydrogenase, partial [Actinobacteria bacterium]